MRPFKRQRIRECRGELLEGKRQLYGRMRDLEGSERRQGWWETRAVTLLFDCARGEPTFVPGNKQGRF